MYSYVEERHPTLYMGRHLAITVEPSVCGGDAVLCQITFTTCYCYKQICAIASSHYAITEEWEGIGNSSHEVCQLKRCGDRSYAFYPSGR